MDVLVTLVVWGLMTWGTAKIAQNNGRDPVLAGVLGFVGGIFALVGYLIAGKTLEKKVEEQKLFNNLVKEGE